MSVVLASASSQMLQRTASVFDQTADFTFSIWKKSPGSVTSGAALLYVGNAGPGSLADALYSNLVGTSNFRIHSRNHDGSEFDFGDGSAPSADVWQRFSLVRSGSSLLFYVRAAGGSTTLDITIGINSGLSVATMLGIGARAGIPDEYNSVRVAYARAFTVAQTTGQQDAEAVSPTAVGSNCWGSWKFLAATDLTDDSGNGRDFTGVNSPTTNADTPSDVIIPSAGAFPQVDARLRGSPQVNRRGLFASIRNRIFVPALPAGFGRSSSGLLLPSGA